MSEARQNPNPNPNPNDYPSHQEIESLMVDAVDAAEAAGVESEQTQSGREYETEHTWARKNSRGAVQVGAKTPEGKTYYTEGGANAPEGWGIGEQDVIIEDKKREAEGEEPVVPALTGERAKKAAAIVGHRASRNLLDHAVETVDDRQRRVKEIAEKHKKQK